MVLDGVGMVEAKPHLKWLGVVFNRKLTFKDQVRAVTAKALRATSLLARVNQCYRGLPPRLAVTAVKAVVLSNTLYASDAW